MKLHVAANDLHRQKRSTVFLITWDLCSEVILAMGLVVINENLELENLDTLVQLLSIAVMNRLE